MAEDVTPAAESTDLVDPPADESIEAETAKPINIPVPRSERARKSAYRFRFVLFYFALAVVAGSALGAFVVVLSRPRAPSAVAWSSWKPNGHGDTAKVLQIADYVPKGYRLAGGKPFVLAHASPPSVSTTIQGQPVDLPIAQITLLPALDTIDASSSVQISFCGTGASCPVQLTRASATLLRRETLEMALFTFKYVKGIESITFLLPPTTPQTAIFLQRSDVTKQLGIPLSRSLAEKPPKLNAIPHKELDVINAITHPHLYHFDVRQEPGGSVVEVLTPFSSNGT